MKINWVQVQGFRSIEDTGKVYIDPNITVLAGKNESGKSTILEALKAFPDKSFSNEDAPLNGTGFVAPRVKINFSLTKGQLEEISGDAATSAKSLDITITRHQKFVDDFEGPAYDLLTSALYQKYKTFKSDIDQQIRNIYSATKHSKYSAYKWPNYVNGYTIHVNNEVKSLKDVVAKREDTDGSLRDKLSNLEASASDLRKVNSEINGIEEQIRALIPTFVLFSSFEDILPFTVTANEAKDSAIVRRILQIAGTDPESVFGHKEPQKRKKATDTISSLVTGEFGEYYKQNTINLVSALDGDNLHFYIYDEDLSTPFRPEQRSKGLQWFLSFFITLNAELDADSVILIDEPGLFLHAKAQNDVLQLLEKISEDHQIIFTTHSPYLIDADKLERLRLVSKDKKACKTIVENKFYKGADRDTLTPVLTAIGLDLSKDIAFSKKCNVLTEGVSDYFYLQAMRKFLGKSCALSSDISFIPCNGADQIKNVAALLTGWDVSFKVLLDNDSAGNTAQAKLKKTLALDNGDIIFAMANNGSCIEDLFSPEDFADIVLEESSDSGKQIPNSKRVKSSEKVLVAKRLCSKINNLKKSGKSFDEVTTSNFKALFHRISKAVQ